MCEQKVLLEIGKVTGKIITAGHVRGYMFALKGMHQGKHAFFFFFFTLEVKDLLCFIHFVDML